jgi:hypothetical protein
MMKSNLATIATALIGMVAFAAEQKLSAPEIEQANTYLQEARNEVIGATKGLTPAQWKYKPAPDKWSIAEIVEHIVLAQELIDGPVWQQLASAPPAPADRDNRTVDSVVMNLLPDRSSKFQAPDPLKPTGRWTPAVALERFLKNDARMRELLQSPDLRDHVVAAPPLKAVSKGKYETMDGYQWLLAAAGHAERHVKQMLEVKADAGFPLK